MKRQEKEDVTLAPGRILSVTTNANSTGRLVRNGDSVGAQGQGTTFVGASTTASVGPFMTTTRWSVHCDIGDSVTFAMSIPAQPASSQVISATITPTSVGAQSVSKQNFTFPGVNALDMFASVSGNPGANLGIAGSRVVGADTVEVSFVNPTAGALTPTAGVYTVVVAR